MTEPPTVTIVDDAESVTIVYYSSNVRREGVGDREVMSEEIRTICGCLRWPGRRSLLTALIPQMLRQGLLEGATRLYARKVGHPGVIYVDRGAKARGALKLIVLL